MYGPVYRSQTLIPTAKRASGSSTHDPGTLHRDSSERVVRLTVFDQDGHSGVPAKIDGLLRLGFGLEPDFAVDYREPHRDQVRHSVGAQRRHRCRTALFDEARDFGLGHRDLTTLLSCHGRVVLLRARGSEGLTVSRITDACGALRQLREGPPPSGLPVVYPSDRWGRRPKSRQ